MAKLDKYDARVAVRRKEVIIFNPSRGNDLKWGYELGQVLHSKDEVRGLDSDTRAYIAGIHAGAMLDLASTPSGQKGVFGLVIDGRASFIGYTTQKVLDKEGVEYDGSGFSIGEVEGRVGIQLGNPLDKNGAGWFIGSGMRVDFRSLTQDEVATMVETKLLTMEISTGQVILFVDVIKRELDSDSIDTIEYAFPDPDIHEARAGLRFAF